MSELYDLEKITTFPEAEEVVNTVLADITFDPLRDVGNKLPYTKRVSINDIVSDEYQQRLMAIDDTMTNCYWMIGDITHEIILSINHTKAKDNGKLISKTDIFEAVGLFCHRTARSVRYYWEAAHYFPVEVRQKYNVPFNVYAEARWVNDWERLLQLAESNPMWGAERVRAEYHKLSGEEFKTRDKACVPQIEGVCAPEHYPLPEDSEEVWVGQSPSRFKEVLLSKLDHTADDLRAVLDRLQLPVDLRKRIGNILLELQDISMAVRREA